MLYKGEQMTYEDTTLLCELLFEILKYFKAAKFSHLIKILDYEKEVAHIKNMKIHIQTHYLSE